MFLDIVRDRTTSCVVAILLQAWAALSSGVPCLERALEHKPHNILLVLVGPGILWSDWNGFNGGGPYAASTDASAAVLNTNIATAMSALVWIMWDTIYYKKPSVLGGVNDMTAGLVAIAPAAGVVAGWGAIVIGIGLR